MAQEWARYDIRVNAIAPGYIETELNADFFASEKGQEFIERFLRKTGRQARGPRRRAAAARVGCLRLRYRYGYRGG